MIDFSPFFYSIVKNSQFTDGVGIRGESPVCLSPLFHLIPHPVTHLISDTFPSKLKESIHDPLAKHVTEYSQLYSQLEFKAYL